METYICDCGHAESPHLDITRGFGTDRNGKTKCYTCCAEDDKQYLRENGQLTGYFVKKETPNPFGSPGSVSQYAFVNWPSSFVLPARWVKKSWHNFAGKNGRTDFWVWFEGKCYHGVQIGHFNQLATIRLLKKQPK